MLCVSLGPGCLAALSDTMFGKKARNELVVEDVVAEEMFVGITKPASSWQMAP